MTSSDEELNEIKHRKLVEMMQHKSGAENGNGKPVVLTDATFERMVTSSPVTVVDFWAAWCGPCRIVAPIIDQLAKEYAGRVTFGKLNVDENPAVSNAFQIQSIPSLLVFKNGKLVDGLVGAAPKQLIESRITPYLKA
jgi:thioredoxin 1